MAVTQADVVRIVKELMRPTNGRVKGMVRRATLGTLKTNTLLQSIQAGTLKDDEDDDVELFEPYGFTSGPVAGSEGLILRVGGQRAGSVGIMFGNRTFRLQVEEGEVAIYDDQGASIILKRSGDIECTPGPGGVVQLGGAAAVLAVARETDPTAADTSMTAWIAAVTAAVTTMAGLFNVAGPMVGAPGTVTTIPVAPSDFGIIASGGSGSTST